MGRWRHPICLISCAACLRLGWSQADSEIPPGQTDPGDQVEEGDSESEHESFAWLTPEKLREAHRRIDANGDGNLTRAELLEFQSRMQGAVTARQAKALFSDLDGNSDGRISMEEFQTGMHEPDPEEFKLVDIDGDGFLNATDVKYLVDPTGHQSLLQHQANEHFEQMSSDNSSDVTWKDFSGSDVVDNSTFWLEYERAMFNALDKNGNGVLSRQELVEYASGKVDHHITAEEIMRAADKNGDGRVTVDELTGSAEQLMSKKGAWEAIQSLLEHPAHAEDL